MDTLFATGSTTPAAPPPIDSPSLAALGRDVAELTREAALVLGATPDSAARIGEQGLLTVDGMGVGIVPVVADATGRQGLLVTVFTGHAVAVTGGAVGALQHAPGLLVSFDATLGCSAAGVWTLMRWLPLEGTAARALAEQIVVTRELVDIVWPPTAH